jgi:HEAT repeat protein
VGGLDAAKAFDTLVRFAGDGSSTVREAAVFGLMFGRDPRKIDPLLKAMRDNNGGVRGRACEALESVPDKRAVPALIEALADPEGAVRQPAIRVLESWTGQTLDYNPHDPLHLGPTVAKWREWWRQNEGTFQWRGSAGK